MSKGIFITATGTDIGKTFVTGLIVKKLRDAGFRAGYYKAALSGAKKTEEGLLPGDADYVNRVAGIGESMDHLVSYVYENAVSPHLAAKLEGNPVEMSVVKEAYERVCQEYDYVTMEGSGGIVCPIRYDESAHIFLEDIIKELGLSAVLVADAGLGTINSIVLTAEYMKKRNISIKGMILNHYHQGDVMEEDNRKMAEEITGIPVIGLVSEDDTELKTDLNLLLSLYE